MTAASLEKTSGEVLETIKKWYSALSFPKKYDDEFEAALSNIYIPEDTKIEDYDINCSDGKKNLLAVLYMCEAAERKFKSFGVPEKIILDTLSDIPIWCENWSFVKSELYLGELEWLSLHLNAKIFRLGRLQFAIAGAKHRISKYSVLLGDPVIEVHIPQGEKLTKEACDLSFEFAKDFFSKYFPSHKYKCFTCHSWLLDDTLRKYLSSESAILSFGDRFDRVHYDESYALVRYIFPWDTTEENIKDREPISSFAKRIKDAVLSGEKFYEVLGVII